MKALAAAALTLLLCACGGGEDAKNPSNAIEETIKQADEWPPCDEVWVVGSTLPKDYEGCTSDDGSIVPIVIAYECADGTTLTFVDEPAAFARIGGEIKVGSNQSNAFGAELDRCDPA